MNTRAHVRTQPHRHTHTHTRRTHATTHTHKHTLRAFRSYSLSQITLKMSRASCICKFDRQRHREGETHTRQKRKERVCVSPKYSFLHQRSKHQILLSLFFVLFFVFCSSSYCVFVLALIWDPSRKGAGNSALTVLAPSARFFVTKITSHFNGLLLVILKNRFGKCAKCGSVNNRRPVLCEVSLVTHCTRVELWNISVIVTVF